MLVDSLGSPANDSEKTKIIQRCFIAKLVQFSECKCVSGGREGYRILPEVNGFVFSVLCLFKLLTDQRFLIQLHTD